MDPRRGPLAVPKVRRAGFFTSIEPSPETSCPNRSLSGPAEAITSSSPLSDSSSGQFISPVQILPSRHHSDNLASRAAPVPVPVPGPSALRRQLASDRALLVGREEILWVFPYLNFTNHLSTSFHQCRPDNDQWLLFLSRNGIKELVLELGEGEFRVPSCLFKCLKLTRLELCHCEFDPPKSFNGFSSLKSLNLHQILVKFLGGVPLLEKLVDYIYFTKYLSIGDDPGRLPITYIHLKTIELYQVSFEDANEETASTSRRAQWWQDPASSLGISRHACRN